MSDHVEVKISKAVPAGATAVAVPVHSDRLNRVEGVRKAVLDRNGFTGRAGTTLVLDDGERARVLVGMGPSGDAGRDQLRTAGAAFVRAASRHRRLGMEVPEIDGIGPDDTVRALAEGLVLGGYRFDEHRSSQDRPAPPSVTLATDGDLRAARAAAERGTQVALATCFARDLVNEPGGTLTPTVFAERAAERAREAGLEAVVMDRAAIEAEGLGGLLAVNQGSAEEPRLLKLTYEPPAGDGDPAAGEDDGEGGVDTVALVGKGITFDSGGLSIKTGEGMMTMKCDMAGAAAVVAAMSALPALGVGVRVVSFTPMTDNMTGGSAQRPGDVFTARDGTTVEVLNTDAEGRLVLADALCLAGEEDPAAIVDLATLTGACMVALGDRIAGLMGNDPVFSGVVEQAAEVAGERVWQLPLPADYRSQLDSQVADLKNIGGGRYGGALTAGLFLSEFVDDDTPWVHLDIAGPSFLSEPHGVDPKGGTGFGVRTLLALLEGWGPHRWTATGTADTWDDVELREREFFDPEG